MAGFNWASFRKGMDDAVARYKDGEFANGVISCMALLAAADGEVEQAERKRVGDLIARDPLFASFNKTTLANQFNEQCLQALDDVLQSDVFETVIRGAKGDPVRADKLLRYAASIAKSDGEVEEAEKEVIRKLASRLSLNAATYGA